jgi:hypothetical protein
MIIATLCGLFKVATGYAVNENMDYLTIVGFIVFMVIEIFIEVLIIACCIKYLSSKGK